MGLDEMDLSLQATELLFARKCMAVMLARWIRTMCQDIRGMESPLACRRLIFIMVKVLKGSSMECSFGICQTLMRFNNFCFSYNAQYCTSLYELLFLCLTFVFCIFSSS